MIHPHTVVDYVSADVGVGTVATAPLPVGTIVWVRDRLDRLFSPERSAALGPAFAERFRAYTWLTKGERLLHWDNAIFVNHSCEPTMMWLVEDWIEIAIRDIAPGEPLTEDYAAMHLPDDERGACGCGAPACRGEYSNRGEVSLRPAWERQVRAAARASLGVEQPLLGALTAGDRARFEAMIEDRLRELP